MAIRKATYPFLIDKKKNILVTSSVLLIQCKNLSVERKLSEEAKENLKKVAKQMGAKPLHIFNRKHKLVIEEIE